jgi:hypothetical protein
MRLELDKVLDRLTNVPSLDQAAADAAKPQTRRVTILESLMLGVVVAV